MRTARASPSQSARPNRSAPPRTDPPAGFLDQLHEYQGEARDGHAPRSGPQPWDACDVDDGVRDPSPEEKLGTEKRHRIVDSDDVSDEHEYREQDQAFQHVAVRARGASRPARHFGEAV